ncbi:MAG TPA: serine/threonine-protein kinase, partial [Polyangiaceae bacterium]|nr:serine/threonine-protein kinase [Polyangiaceae bacterium]
MGTVWEGTHTTLGTQVAVKFIDAEYAESPEARNRFESEARAAARLRSKHVVEVYDHGVTDDGRPFIVMEYLRGEALDARLEKLGRLSAKETARIVMQVCRALSKAHAAGIVHRDLKPENVFLVWDDEDGADVAKVVDFGIAKFTDNQLGNSSATRTGSVLGTPYYMSPEQARGLRSVDHRSDLWSVGVIAYRCIVGQLPFDGEAVGDLLVKLCTAPLPIPSQVALDVPPGFDAWFTKALSREPQERFATANELADALANVCGLPVRGSFSTGDIPIPSFASGPMAASGNRLPAVVSVTPYPSADGS